MQKILKNSTFSFIYICLIFFNNMANKNKIYDTIIIGGGCAGYPAAIYSARFNLKSLVIAKEQGGALLNKMKSIKE